MPEKAPPSGAGVINPWAKKSSDFTEPRPWKEFVKQYELSEQQYSTPFCVFTDLLDRWTSSISTKTTPECNDEERLKRLFEVVGGYPRIANGYRPLDFPALPLAMPSLVLSLYLDSIPVETDFSWHSLRSYMMIEDLKMRNELKNSNSQKNSAEDSLIHLTHLLVSAIRKHENSFAPGKFSDENLTSKERIFLAVLHSTDHARLKYWPRSKEHLVCKTTGISEHFSRLKYHEFKFEKIQTWIQKWAQGFEIENSDHNFLIGPSVSLEAIFCRVRSYILVEYGIGSICIDGGGRIAFLSTEKIDDVEAKIHRFVNESFLENRDTRIHRHPYHETIEIYMKDYVQKTKQNAPIRWKEFQEYQNKQPEKSSNTGIGPAIAFFLSGDKMRPPILPEISQSDFQQEFQKQAEIKICNHTSKVISQNDAHKASDCELCQGIPSQTNFQPKIENCHELCTMHWLLWGIAKDSKLRHSGLRTEMGPGFGDQKFGKITDIIALDGNCLGSIFCESFEWEFENPLPKRHELTRKINSDSIEEIWKENFECYVSLQQSDSNIERDHWLRLLETHDLDPEKFLDALVKQFDERTRLKAILRRMRRSFDFNANWALSFHNSILKPEKSLSPWIYAGDDMVLVNRSGMNQNEIKSVLQRFHDELQQNLPRCNMSFAGGWAQREGGPIRNTLANSLTSEKVAKHTWKHEISETELAELLGKDEVERRTGCKICANIGLNLSEDPDESCSSYRFEGRGQKPHSLLIRLNSDALSNLEKQEESEYKK